MPIFELGASLENTEKCESFILEKVIGIGTTSVVYLATCTKGRLIGRRVVVKSPRHQGRNEKAIYELPAFLRISPVAEDLIQRLFNADPAQRLPLCDVLTHPFLDASLPSRNLESHFRNSADHDKELVFTESGSASKTAPLMVMGGRNTAKMNRFARQTPKLANPVLSEGNDILTTVISTESVLPLQSPLQLDPPFISRVKTPSSIREAWRRLSARPESENSNAAYNRDSRPPSVAYASGPVDEQQKIARKPLGEIGNINYVSRCMGRRGPGEKEDGEIRGGEDVQARSSSLSAIPSPPPTFPSSLQPKDVVQTSSAAPNVASSHPSECDDRDIGIHCLQEKGILTANLNAASSNEDCPPAILRTSAPTCLHIAPLLPQTHKVAQGQLVVMPSRSLLVDLREGERRAGGKGTSVLVISPDGQQIKVYEALHLSTPSVLSEPQAIWVLDELPERYWGSYRFASLYIETLKKRTPWIVWNTPEAKFMVMSNGPKGDIHATFPCPTNSLKEGRYVSREVAESSTRMKIRFSRQQGTVEISRFRPSTKKRGKGEWVFKSETIMQEQLVVGDTSFQKMTVEERLGLGYIIEGLKLVEAAEKIYRDADRCGGREDPVARRRSDLPGSVV
ncbi:hypothetical protein BU17DRAFT_81641 [Hysterangium stoloniferum]|nr:hypothetical protein BU17DRAFT_81641 [Hysterangium stoloniferum]